MHFLFQIQLLAYSTVNPVQSSANIHDVFGTISTIIQLRNLYKSICHASACGRSILAPFQINLPSFL